MSTNISKKKRDDLLDKIKQIRAFIAAAPQDENTGNLLSYLSELEKDVNGKKYGLVFEEHREEIDEVLLSDVMTAGFEENDSCFINWEKLTKKGNNALKDSERTNFLEHIEHALNDGLRFIIIVDESHQNNTIKADEIIQYFRTEKIIRCSATPKGIAKAEVIEIPEEEVIAAGLIKKMLVINQDFPQQVEMENATNYLLEQAYAKQREIRAEFLSAGKDINPLIVVQIPNKSEKLQDDVERWFETQGV
mgnify:CR=1 FL=1